jgi:diacylglycerol kinase family enzyme
MTDRSADGALRITAIVNLVAGAVERQGLDIFTSNLASAFEQAGVAAVCRLIEAEQVEAEAKFALERARAGEIDAVVVGGGDGTVRTVASLLADTGVALGILPLGTLNHFARDLGIPLDLAGAVATIAARHFTIVDVGEVNGEMFINNSSIGIYPYMVADRERRQSATGLSKWMAMALAAVRAVRRFPRRRLSLHAEGRVAAYRTPCLFVGNNAYDLNFPSLGRRQHLDEGRLYVYVAKPMNVLGFLWFILRTALGRGSRLAELDTLRLTSAEIRSRASRLPVALDGELRTMPTPLRYHTRPGALKVFAPASPSVAPG